MMNLNCDLNQGASVAWQTPSGSRAEATRRSGLAMREVLNELVRCHREACCQQQRIESVLARAEFSFNELERLTPEPSLESAPDRVASTVSG